MGGTEGGRVVTDCPISFARFTDALHAARSAFRVAFWQKGTIHSAHGRFRAVYWTTEVPSEYVTDNLCNDWGLLFEVGAEAFEREHAPRAALAAALFGWLSFGLESRS